MSFLQEEEERKKRQEETAGTYRGGFSGGFPGAGGFPGDAGGFPGGFPEDFPGGFPGGFPGAGFTGAATAGSDSKTRSRELCQACVIIFENVRKAWSTVVNCVCHISIQQRTGTLQKCENG